MQYRNTHEICTFTSMISGGLCTINLYYYQAAATEEEPSNTSPAPRAPVPQAQPSQAMDLTEAEIFRVDVEADNIEDSDLSNVWPQVEAADLAEIRQFVEEKAFRKIHLDSLTSETMVVDSRWVRKWKRIGEVKALRKGIHGFAEIHAGHKEHDSDPTFAAVPGVYVSKDRILSRKLGHCGRFSQRLLVPEGEGVAAASWNHHSGAQGGCDGSGERVETFSIH